jgi:hypothetical protein
MDVRQKMRTRRCYKKQKLKTQPGKTPAMVRERVGDVPFTGWDLEDVTELLARWCDEAFQVRRL